MMRRMLLMPVAVILTAFAAVFTTSASAGEGTLTLRIQGFEPISVISPKDVHRDGIVMPHHLMYDFFVDLSGLNLHQLASYEFAEQDLDLRLEVTRSGSMVETANFTAPDFLLLPRGAGKIIYESRPYPTKIATLELRKTPGQSDEEIGLESGENEQPACTGTSAEYELWTYIDEETLDSDERVQKLLSALSTLVAQANVSRDWNFPLTAGAWSWTVENVFDWNRGLQQPDIFGFQNQLRDYGEPANINRDFLDDYLPRLIGGQPWPNTNPYGVFGWNDPINPPDVDRACDETWSFFPVSHPGWNLDLAETLTVRVEPEFYFDVFASQSIGFAQIEQVTALAKIEQAIGSGAFAARGLVVDVEFGTHTINPEWFNPRDDLDEQDASLAKVDIILEDRRFRGMGLSFGRDACDDRKWQRQPIELDSALWHWGIAGLLKPRYDMCVKAEDVGDPRIEAFFDALSSSAPFVSYGVL